MRNRPFRLLGREIELANNPGVFSSNTDQDDIAKRVGGPKGAVILRHSNLISFAFFFFTTPPTIP